jgi:hypothetical protein
MDDSIELDYDDKIGTMTIRQEYDETDDDYEIWTKETYLNQLKRDCIDRMEIQTEKNKKAKEDREAQAKRKEEHRLREIEKKKEKLLDFK